METTAAAGTLTDVTDIDPLQHRIDALTQELDRHPEITIDRLAKAAGFSYQTWRNMVTGKSRRPATLEHFEQALEDLVAHPDDIEEEPTHVVSSPQPSELIELEVTGDFGVRIVVRAPVANADELERFAAKIIRDIRAGQEPSRGSE